MNQFFVEGDEAKRRAEQSSSTTKVNYLSLKAGESKKVVLLDMKFPMYYGHGDFNLRIPSHLCTSTATSKCRSCQAGVRRMAKYLVPFFDLEAKEILYWDTTKKHIACVYSAIDEYGEDVLTTPFIMKRTGSGAQDTSYSFMPMSPKQQKDFPIPAEAQPFEFGSQERSDAYNSVIRVPSDEYLDKILANATGVESAEGQGNDHGF